jgi:hypothetical protein
MIRGWMKTLSWCRTHDRCKRCVAKGKTPKESTPQCWHELDQGRPRSVLGGSGQWDIGREAAARNMLAGLYTGQHIRAEVLTPLVPRMG